MRLPILDPKGLSNGQKPLYADMRTGIESHFKGFVNMRPDGALLGPWNPWLNEPQFGKPVWELVKAMVANPSLPAAVREVAILVTGSHFRSGYELYAHVLVAEQRGYRTKSWLRSLLAKGPSISLGRKQWLTTLLLLSLTEASFRSLPIKPPSSSSALMERLSYLISLECIAWCL